MLERRPVQLDFSSSGQGTIKTTALVADGICLVNATSLLDFESIHDKLQVVICESCGITQCEPGGWIAVRRLADAVLWIPCFDAMETESLTEFAPPKYEARTPWFSLEKYQELRDLIPGFPPFDSVEPLTSRDAVRLIQRSAPGLALGKFPNPPHLKRDAIVATNSGDVEPAVTRFEELIRQAWQVNAPLCEVAEAEPISFYVDLPGTPQWTPFATCGTETALSLYGEHLLVTKPSA